VPHRIKYKFANKNGHKTKYTLTTDLLGQCTISKSSVLWRFRNLYIIIIIIQSLLPTYRKIQKWLQITLASYHRQH